MENKKDFEAREKKSNNKRKQQLQEPLSDSSDDEMELEQIDLTKKRNEIQQEEDNDQQEDGDFNDDYDQMDVEFSFMDPTERHFHSVKNLLNSYLENISNKSSDLANIVVNQACLGTMIGIEDKEEETKDDQPILGFVTIINMAKYKQEKFMGEIFEFLKDKSKYNNSKHQEFLTILNSKKVGLFINERILNLAPTLVPTLHGQLLEDLNWILKDKDEEALQFDLDYLIFISKTYKVLENKPKDKKQKTQEEIIYQRFEDDRFQQASKINFTFEAQSEKNKLVGEDKEFKGQQQICYRMVLVLKMDDYKKTVPMLQLDLLENIEQ